MSRSSLFTATGAILLAVASGFAQWQPTSGPTGAGFFAACAQGNAMVAASAGQGFFRSADSGASWIAVPGTADIGTRSLIAGGGGFLAATANGCLRSTDGGVTWQAWGPTQRSVSYLAAGRAAAYAVISDSLYRRGWTETAWTRLPGRPPKGTLNALAAGDSGLFAHVSWDALYRSRDEGATWAKADMGTRRTSYDMKLLHSEGALLLAGTGGNDIYRSLDFGKTWQPSPAPVNGSFAGLANAGGSLYLGMGSTLYPVGMFRSDDQGAHWSSLQAGMTNRDLAGAAALGASVIAVTSGGIFRSANQGSQWAHLPVGRAGMFTLASEGSVIYASSWAGAFSSADRGAHWTSLNAGLPDIRVRCLASLGGVLVAGTLDSGAFVSHDQGAHWASAPIGSAGERLLSLCRIGRNLIAGTAGTLYRSQDEGDHWKRSDSGFFPSYVNDLIVHGGIVYAAADIHGLYRSLDSGATWSEFDEGLGGPSYQVDRFGILAGELYANNRYELFKLQAGTGQWELTAPAMKGSLWGLTAGKGKLFALTTAGVFRLDGNGTAWYALEPGVAPASALSLLVAGEDLFLGSQNQGVFRRDLAEAATGLVPAPRPLRAASPRYKRGWLSRDGMRDARGRLPRVRR